MKKLFIILIVLFTCFCNIFAEGSKIKKLIITESSIKDAEIFAETANNWDTLILYFYNDFGTKYTFAIWKENDYFYFVYYQGETLIDKFTNGNKSDVITYYKIAKEVYQNSK